MNSENLSKLSSATDSTDITLINPPRPGKKLLVLDLDHCILHFSSKLPPERSEEMKRPHMDKFLTLCYQEYDLVIWSQTHWKWVEMKLTELGMLEHPDYKVEGARARISLLSVSSVSSVSCVSSLSSLSSLGLVRSVSDWP